MTFMVNNVDYDSLVANDALKAAMEDTIKAEVEAQSGVPKENIILAFSKGSLVVDISYIGITTQQDQNVLTNTMTNRSWQVIVEQKVAAKIADLPDIGLIKTGVIEASFIGFQLPPTPVPTPAPTWIGVGKGTKFEEKEEEEKEEEDEVSGARRHRLVACVEPAIVATGLIATTLFRL